MRDWPFRVQRVVCTRGHNYEVSDCDVAIRQPIQCQLCQIEDKTADWLARMDPDRLRVEGVSE
jgi:hypothetical protein